MRWHPRIAGVGEITVAGSADESAVPRWVEPSDRLAVSNDRSRRSLGLDCAASTPTAMTPMTAAVSVVLVIALVTVELLPAGLVLALIVRGRWR
jgi:hypothetical protein